MHLEILFFLLMEMLAVSGMEMEPLEQVITGRAPGRAAEARGALEILALPCCAPRLFLKPLPVAQESQKFSLCVLQLPVQFLFVLSSHVCLEAEHQVRRNEPGLKITQQPAEV